MNASKDKANPSGRKIRCRLSVKPQLSPERLAAIGVGTVEKHFGFDFEVMEDGYLYADLPEWAVKSHYSAGQVDIVDEAEKKKFGKPKQAPQPEKANEDYNKLNRDELAEDYEIRTGNKAPKTMTRAELIEQLTQMDQGSESQSPVAE